MTARPGKHYPRQVGQVDHIDRKREMGYIVDGVELEADEQGFLLEPNYSDEAVKVIAAAEGIALTDAHWEVVNFLREEYKARGHTPYFRSLL